MRATWYTLEDGSPVDPAEVTRDKSGALVHKSGKVAIGDHGNHRTMSVELDDNGKLIDPKPKKAEKQSEPEAPPKSYKTRESKAR